MSTENPIKKKRCCKCKMITYYTPSRPYQNPEERNPSKCVYCNEPFKQ